MTIFRTPSTAISELWSLINACAVACRGSASDIRWWHPVRQLPNCWLVSYPKIFNTQPFEGGNLRSLYVLTQFILSLFYGFHFGRAGFLLLLHWQWDSMTACSCCCLFCFSAWYPNWHRILESAWDYKLYTLAKSLGSLRLHSWLPAVLIRDEFMFICSVDNRSWNHVSFYLT